MFVPVLKCYSDWFYFLTNKVNMYLRLVKHYFNVAPIFTLLVHPIEHYLLAILHIFIFISHISY